MRGKYRDARSSRQETFRVCYGTRHPSSRRYGGPRELHPVVIGAARRQLIWSSWVSLIAPSTFNIRFRL